MKPNEIEIVSQVMTPVPKSIGPELPISAAQELMSRNKIRHLPVMVGNRVIGVLTDRNVKAAALSNWGKEFTVKDVMMTDPYVVRPSANLEEVLTQMMKYKYGSVIVQDKGGEVTGIFTAVDGLWLLRKILKDSKPRKARKQRDA
jgi:acetoin utilization protein AcuB